MSCAVDNLDPYEFYGWVVEVKNIYIGHNGDIQGESWWRYNKKVYDSYGTAKKAIEENPYYKKSDSGFMADYRIREVYVL